MYLEGSKELFLKSSKLNSMKREYENTNFLNLKCFKKITGDEDMDIFAIGHSNYTIIRKLDIE